MSLEVLQSPEYITPVYNPVPFVINSDNTAEENFRYICYVKDCDGNLLTTITQPAYPTEGVGFFNLQKICSAYVPSTSPSELYTQLYKTPEQACFSAEFAESFTTYFTCTAVQIDVSPVDGYNLLFFFTNGHSFVTGDIISFSGTGEIGELYNNTWEVIQTPSPFVINVNGINQGTASSATTATCVLASGQRTTYPIVSSATTEFWVNNSALDTCDWLSYKLDEYNISRVSGSTWPIKWYNNIPQPYPLREGNYLDAVVLYSQSDYPTDTPNAIIVRTTDSTGGTYTYTSPNIPDTSWSGASTFMIPCGPANLNIANVAALWTASPPATFPIIKPNTTSYIVRLRNGLASVTEDLEFTIDDSCSKYDNFEINFLDRKGNYIPFNFTLVQRKNVSVNRLNFKKGLGNVNANNGFFYSCKDRGTSTINNIITYQYTLQSNWLSNDMSEYFEELITSPNVFWNYNGSGDFRPITLNTNSVEILTKKNSRMIAYQITFNSSINPVVQQGV
jgi:hypothetical protein